MSKPKAYFARALNTYHTDRDYENLKMIRDLGFSPVNPALMWDEEKYEEEGMDMFLKEVRKCDVLIFKPLPDGSIPAGVGKEIGEANMNFIPVIEIPSGINRRVLSVHETREYLIDVGHR